VHFYFSTVASLSQQTDFVLTAENIFSSDGIRQLHPATHHESIIGLSENVNSVIAEASDRSPNCPDAAGSEVADN